MREAYLSEFNFGVIGIQNCIPSVYQNSCKRIDSIEVFVVLTMVKDTHFVCIQTVTWELTFEIEKNKNTAVKSLLLAYSKLTKRQKWLWKYFDSLIILLGKTFNSIRHAFLTKFNRFVIKASIIKKTFLLNIG